MEKEIEKYSIIGKGTFGKVIHPAILCSEMSNPDKHHYVSKILPIDQARKEIESLDKLPKELDGILYFTEKSYCLIDETNKQILVNLGINSKNMACVNMVFLPGLELNVYIEQYKTEDNQTNTWSAKYEIRDEIPELPREILLELLMGLSRFYPKVLSLNRDYNYYHNDLSTTNIMYVNNEYYLIDFGFSNDNDNDNQKDTNKDIHGLIQVFNEILSCIPYITDNEDVKLIHKTYKDELNAFRKSLRTKPQEKKKIDEFNKTLFETTLKNFIEMHLHGSSMTSSGYYTPQSNSLEFVTPNSSIAKGRKTDKNEKNTQGVKNRQNEKNTQGVKNRQKRKKHTRRKKQTNESNFIWILLYYYKAKSVIIYRLLIIHKFHSIIIKTPGYSQHPRCPHPSCF